MIIKQLKLKQNILLAPMAGITDLTCRLVMRPFGIGLAFTEMVSANGLVLGGDATRNLLASTPEDRPLGIQLFGENPQTLGEACKMVEQHGDLIDLNIGCPVKKVVRSGAGSALMRTPDLVAEIVAAMRRATNLPLTVKIRAGWDQNSINFLQIANIAEQEGADAITLHPRTRSQGFSGTADWSLIAELKSRSSIPIIGSGDIFNPEDAMLMLQQTGCDAIMLGRGCYGNPWLTKNILALQHGEKPRVPTVQERRDVALRHMETFLRLNSERKTVLDMRKHLCWYAKGIPGAAQFRSRINQAATIDAMRDLIRHFFDHTTRTTAEVS
jgi:nifR3 family TIM-barrel protein